ncbi:MAG: hypothetical protein Q8L27_04465, partial [archaeon]|nr:hypothetical protein [archaeon]
EIGKLQRYTLDYVSNDNLLRGQVLGGYLGGVNDKLQPIIPGDYSYLIKTCPYNLTYNDICSLGFIVPGEVYSDDTLLFANLTYYNPEQAVKLKIFIWPGEFPEGKSAPDYYWNKPASTCSDDCSAIGNTKCFNSTSFQTCGDFNGDGCYDWSSSVTACSGTTPLCNVQSGNCDVTTAQPYVSKWTTSNVYNWVNPATGIINKRIDWSITISNKNNVNFFIKNFTECWRLLLPGDTKNCKVTLAPLGLVLNSYTNFTTNQGVYTTLVPNTYNLTYSGIDVNGHDFSFFKQIEFS